MVPSLHWLEAAGIALPDIVFAVVARIIINSTDGDPSSVLLNRIAVESMDNQPPV